MTKRKVLIAHQTIVDCDAIGNDIMGMATALIKYNYDVKLLCEYSSENLYEFLFEHSLLTDFLNNSNSILIYHHSIDWKWGEEILKKFKGKLILKYHNITSPHFFRPYSEVYYNKCFQGREDAIYFLSDFVLEKRSCNSKKVKKFDSLEIQIEILENNLIYL